MPGLYVVFYPIADSTDLYLLPSAMLLPPDTSWTRHSKGLAFLKSQMPLKPPFTPLCVLHRNTSEALQLTEWLSCTGEPRGCEGTCFSGQAHSFSQIQSEDTTYLGVIGRVVLNNPVHFGDVQPSGCHISAQQYPRIRVAELEERGGSLILLLLSLD